MIESLSFCLRKLSNGSSAVSQMSLPKTVVNFAIEDQWMARDWAPAWTVFFFATSNDGQFWHVFGDIACMALRTDCQLKALPGSKQLATPKMRLTDGCGRRTRSQRKSTSLMRALIIAGFLPGGIYEDTRRLHSLQSSGPLVASIIDGSEYGTGWRLTACPVSRMQNINWLVFSQDPSSSASGRNGKWRFWWCQLLASGQPDTASIRWRFSGVGERGSYRVI
jgi:hypothetical protein